MNYCPTAQYIWNCGCTNYIKRILRSVLYITEITILEANMIVDCIVHHRFFMKKQRRIWVFSKAPWSCNHNLDENFNKVAAACKVTMNVSLGLDLTTVCWNHHFTCNSAFTWPNLSIRFHLSLFKIHDTSRYVTIPSLTLRKLWSIFENYYRRSIRYTRVTWSTYRTDISFPYSLSFRSDSHRKKRIDP